MVSTMNRALWQSIKDADYSVPEGYTIHELTAELVEYLGSTDSVLRDDYAYTILAYWIERGLYTPPQLRELAMQLIGGLTMGLGERKSDTVFLRSFSALVLAEIIHRDNAAPFFTEQEIKTIFRWAVEYLLTERDLRGYIKGKGWAHSVAHTADLLRRLAKSRHLQREDLERMLMAVADKVTAKGEYIYVHNEDERLALAVWTALQRGVLTMPFLIRWLAQCVQVIKLAPPDAPFDPEVFGAYQNTRQLLRSLYFRIALSRKAGPLVGELRPKVLAAVKALGG